MIKIDKLTIDQLLEINKTKKICLEGNILKVIDSEGNHEFQKYINESIEKDKEKQRKRLDITRQVQIQNSDLIKGKEENERVNIQLKEALKEAEESNKAMLIAKQEAETSLEEAEKAKHEAVSAKHEAETARIEAVNAKNSAVNDLEIMQKKTQFEMVGNIVKVALWIIGGVGITVTLVYIVSLFAGFKTEVIGSAWVNVMSILLTNSFSIIGTLMGMKSMSEKDKAK